MQKFNQLIEKDMKIVDQIIHNDMQSNVALINQISHYIINAGGKRIRPKLVLICGKLCGYSNDNPDLSSNNILHKMAAMVEYIHTATLLHDDVVDESGLRRGYQTANNLFGNAASVLVGDFIYTRSFQMMIQSNSIELLKIMANCTNHISEGEVDQLLNIGRPELSIDEYLKVIEAKTAALFEACGRVGGIIANASLAKQQQLAKYTKNLGIAFQIADDILDYIGESEVIGKNVGDDLMEGKITLPLIYTMQMSDNKTNEQIKQALHNPDADKVKFIIQTVSQTNAIELSKQLANKYVKLAISALDDFALSPYKDALIELVNYSVSRLV